jgi:hypothetical protein
MGVEKLYDSLVGATAFHKEEENIRPKEYKIILEDFAKIKSFWGKALFIVYLRTYKDKSKKAIGNKILRDLKMKEPEVYKRHVEPFMRELNRRIFTNPVGLMDNLVDKLMEYGEDEFVSLCRVIYHAGGNDWVTESKKVTLSMNSISLIIKSY